MEGAGSPVSLAPGTTTLVEKAPNQQGSIVKTWMSEMQVNSGSTPVFHVTWGTLLHFCKLLFPIL